MTKSEIITLVHWEGKNKYKTQGRGPNQPPGHRESSHGAPDGQSAPDHGFVYKQGTIRRRIFKKFETKRRYCADYIGSDSNVALHKCE